MIIHVIQFICLLISILLTLANTYKLVHRNSIDARVTITQGLAITGFIWITFLM